MSKGSLATTRRFYIALGLVAIVIFSSWFGVSYYFQTLRGQPSKSGDSVIPTDDSGSNGNARSENDTSYVKVTTLINYGNGVMNWYNATKVHVGWNFYNLTFLLVDGKMETQYYGPPLNGHLILGINGVANQASSSWTLWIYCPKDMAWARSGWGADWLRFAENGLIVDLEIGQLSIATKTLAWYYQDISGAWQPPEGGATQVDFCST